MLEHGYAVAIQDTRGRFASEGIWYPLLDDLWARIATAMTAVAWFWMPHPQ